MKSKKEKQEKKSVRIHMNVTPSEAKLIDSRNFENLPSQMFAKQCLSKYLNIELSI